MHEHENGDGCRMWSTAERLCSCGRPTASAYHDHCAECIRTAKPRPARDCLTRRGPRGLAGLMDLGMRPTADADFSLATWHFQTSNRIQDITI